MFDTKPGTVFSVVLTVSAVDYPPTFWLKLLGAALEAAAYAFLFPELEEVGMLLAVSLLFSALEDLMRWKFFWFVEFWLIGLEMWASWL